MDTLTLCSSATCCFNELIWATALAYTAHTWVSEFQQHFIISDDVVFMAIFWSHIKHPLQDAAGNMLMEPAKDPTPGLNIANPDILCIRQSKWQKRRGEERPPTIFFKWEQWPPMDDAIQSGKGLTRHHPPPPHLCGCNDSLMQQGSVLYHGKTEHSEKEKENCGCKDHICLSDTTNPI